MGDSNSNGHHELYYSRKDERMYLVNADTNTVEKSWECRDECVDGANPQTGQKYESLPVGDYPHCWAEYLPHTKKDIPYGTFDIHTGDKRLRNVHGGGTRCGEDHAFDPEQNLYPTEGCLRMHNKDGEELTGKIKEYGNDITLHVQEKSLELSPKQVQTQTQTPTQAQDGSNSNSNAQKPQENTGASKGDDPGIIERIEKDVKDVEHYVEHCIDDAKKWLTNAVDNDVSNGMPQSSEKERGHGIGG